MWLFGLGNKMDSRIKPYLKSVSKRRIPVIISYKDNPKLIRNKITSNGGKIKYEYSNISAFAGELSPMAIDKLSDIPEISCITMDYKASLCLKKTHDVMGVHYPRIFKLTGKGIGIGLVDTGVYPHPDLTSKRNAICYFEDLINKCTKPYDDNGHGTFMSGCIASTGHMSSGSLIGIAPDANLCVIKAFNSSGKGFLSDIIAAIDKLIICKDTYNIRLINLPFEFPYIDSSLLSCLEDIIKKALSVGISIIVPSGNYGSESYSIYCPGNIKEVITVSGVCCLDTNINNYSISNFSGRGPLLSGISKPDVSAPSVCITSLASNTQYNPSLKTNGDLTIPYVSMSGTSISSALITGACAVILEKTPELSPQDLKSIICLSTINIGENKYSQGSGLFVFDKIIK